MTGYLLAAEADKIQDFVFRASHLREVSGASALLDRFCEQAPQALLRTKCQRCNRQQRWVVSACF